MSSRQGVRSPARGAAAPAQGRTAARREARSTRAWSLEVSRWSGWAWGAIAATAAYIALTCWWLTQDRSIPIYDAGDHLETALLFHQMLAGGEVLGPLNHESPYPPFAPLVGAFAAFLGGVNLASPIIGENLVFVSLLTLGCYQTGRLLFGAKAGMLAAIFVLGSDLLIAQFHVFMLDAPEAAVVAVSIWLLLACEDFSRPGLCAAAGLAVGVGLATKVQYPGFVVGIVLMALAHGGWRNRRGLVAFAAPALLVGAPWYLDHLSQFSTFVKVSTSNPIVVPGDVPPTLSLANFAWYFWNILNSQLLVALDLLLVAGTAWMAVTLFRRRREALAPILGRGAEERRLAARLELFAGALVAWLFITLTPSHDIRYAIPLLPYLAVIATGWIVFMPRAVSWTAIAVLAVGVTANTLGTTFGVGHTVQAQLVHPLPPGEENADAVTLYSTAGFLVAGPQRDGDVPGLLSELRRAGVTAVSWSLAQSREPDFDTEGLLPLARIADLQPVLTGLPEFSGSSTTATLLHLPVNAQSPPGAPCARLADGTGVWVVRANPASGRRELYCPSRQPQYYGAL
jgi:4-amino-4-deoxy-L-arabinose transferase-like glycosyltransferase